MREEVDTKPPSVTELPSTVARPVGSASEPADRRHQNATFTPIVTGTT